MAHLRVDASPETVHWGFFDAALPPVGEIDSGETVMISTVSGTPDVMPRPPLVVPPALAAIHRQVTKVAIDHGWQPPGYSRVYGIVRSLDQPW